MPVSPAAASRALTNQSPVSRTVACGLPSCKSGKLETTTTPLTDPGVPFGILQSKTFTNKQQSARCVQPVHSNGFYDVDVFICLCYVRKGWLKNHLHYT